ncbi:DUF2231 domain-containing protein [Halobacteriovorax sp. HLS]|uniref:DUF2231 domain-containing protein n=1 Tax=Halobacteriovorax sp. HLS TaxID=2234000 RepID=UPI000FDA872A|nr:DUF2231 domain-containing protein [Halobacteriovorax sp. HLS]
MILIRDELLHPMISHFPIAMFFLAMISKSIELATFLKYRELSHKFNFVTRCLVFSAPLFYLLTIYLGDIATDAIKNEFCELALISKHEQLGYYALYLIIASLVMESLSEIFKTKKFILSIATLFTLIFSNYFIFETAHLGGQLVYEKGAAVKVAPKCN